MISPPFRNRWLAYALFGAGLWGFAEPAAAQSPQVIEGEEPLAFDAPEAWAQKFYTSVGLLTGFGSPARVEPGEFDLGIELGWVPQLSEEERRVGFAGTKVEDLNKTSVYARVRGSVGLPGSLTLAVGLVPPVELGGIKPTLVSASVGRPIWEGHTIRVGLRAYGQLGSVEGDITCAEDRVDTDGGPDDDPYDCLEASNDEATQRYVGGELSVAGRSGAWEPFAAFAVTHLDLEFQIGALYVLGGSTLDDRVLQTASGTVYSGSAGVNYHTRGGWVLGAEAFYTPLDIRRPPATDASNEGLFNLRGIVRYRFGS